MSVAVLQRLHDVHLEAVAVEKSRQLVGDRHLVDAALVDADRAAHREHHERRDDETDQQVHDQCAADAGRRLCLVLLDEDVPALSCAIIEAMKIGRRRSFWISE